MLSVGLWYSLVSRWLFSPLYVMVSRNGILFASYVMVNMMNG